MDYKGKVPKKIKLLNEIIEVKNWRDLFIKCAESLIITCPEEFKNLPYLEKFMGRYLSINDYYLREPYQLSNGYYLETHYDSNTIIRIIKEKLLTGCGFSEDDLNIYLKE